MPVESAAVQCSVGGPRGGDEESKMGGSQGGGRKVCTLAYTDDIVLVVTE